MYEGKKIAAIIPAYNEEKQILNVIKCIPEYVDDIVVIDDKSDDNTYSIVKGYQDNKIILICHDENQGVGAAIASGYKWARDNGVDIAVVMAGDGQMDPADFEPIIDPVVNGKVDYSKGNRLLSGEAYKIIPKVRYWGNAVLSMLTKIVSGYWHVADSQAGYTAINKKVLHTINWDLMYKRYGQPNDILVKLNVYNFRVKDVEIKPVYHSNQESGIKIRKVVFTISWLLLRLFYWRIKEKYIIRDFHPLVFFYCLGFFMFLLNIFFFIRLILLWILNGYIPEITLLIWVFTFSTSLTSCFFAMWFDMENNKSLKGE